jgi:hypothetical protein
MTKNPGTQESKNPGIQETGLIWVRFFGNPCFCGEKAGNWVRFAKRFLTGFTGSTG